jgi:hypothetical protein
MAKSKYPHSEQEAADDPSLQTGAVGAWPDDEHSVDVRDGAESGDDESARNDDR